MSFTEELKKAFESVDMDARLSVNEEARLTQCTKAERAIFYTYLNKMKEGSLSKPEMVEASKLLSESLKYL